jgi:hypothetical protein
MKDGGCQGREESAIDVARVQKIPNSVFDVVCSVQGCSINVHSFNCLAFKV